MQTNNGILHATMTLNYTFRHNEGHTKSKSMPIKCFGVELALLLSGQIQHIFKKFDIIKLFVRGRERDDEQQNTSITWHIHKIIFSDIRFWS